MPPPVLSAVGMALSTCGANPYEIYALEVTERLSSLEAFGRMTLVARLEKRPFPHNVAMIPTRVVKNIQALCCWAAKAGRQGRAIYYGEFDQDTLATALDDMEIQSKKHTSPEIKPSNLKEENWEEWPLEFPTYLSHIFGKQKAPLDYVIRADLDPGHVFTSTRERELYGYLLTGPYFREDNKEVFRLLSNLVKYQPATWIQPYQVSQDGRRAWLALVNHFDGGGQKEKRISKAEAILDTPYYNNERIFSFDSYSAKLIRAFRTLESTPNRRSPSNQVRILLDNIKISTAEFAVIKVHVRSNHRADLHGAIEYISREIAELFPTVVHGQRQPRHRFVSETNSQQPSNRPRNFQGLSLNNGVYTFFGVDVTNVQRRFTSEEMALLGPSGQAYVHQERERLRGQENSGGTAGSGGFGGQGRNSGGRGRGRGVSEIRTTDNSVITNITNDNEETNGDQGSNQGSNQGSTTTGG